MRKDKALPVVDKKEYKDLLTEIARIVKFLGDTHASSSSMDVVDDSEEKEVDVVETDVSTKSTLLTISRGFYNSAQSVLIPILSSKEFTVDMYTRASDCINEIVHNATLAQHLLGSIYVRVEGEDEAEDDESDYTSDSEEDEKDELFYFRSKTKSTPIPSECGPSP